MSAIELERYAGAMAIHGLEWACKLVEQYAVLAGCDPEPEKAIKPPKTQLEALCRLNARLAYLIAIIACGDDQRCCDQAYEDYCDALDKCGQ